MEDLFKKYCDSMGGETIGAHVGVYSVALTGLVIAMRRMRPFSKFARPSDVPNYFIKSRRVITGKVDRVEPNGALLMIKHTPPIGFSFGGANNTLPVKISGVDVTGNGISWLQTIVSGKEVNLVPILKQSNCIHCEVTYPQVIKKNKVKNVDIGESLVAIGFAKIQPEISELRNLVYVNKLRAAENRALRKQLGVKYYIKPTKLIVASIANKIAELIKKQINAKKQKIAPKANVTA